MTITPDQIRLLTYVHPNMLLMILAILALLLVTSAILELRGSKRELLHILGEEASTLMESIQISGTFAILAYEKIEQQVADRLLNNLYLLDELDQLNVLTPSKLSEVVQKKQYFSDQYLRPKRRKAVIEF